MKIKRTQTWGKSNYRYKIKYIYIYISFEKCVCLLVLFTFFFHLFLGFSGTWSQEVWRDDEPSRAFPKVARKRYERFYGATCKRPDKGSVTQAGLVFSAPSEFSIISDFALCWPSASLLQQARPDDRPVWGQRERGSLQEAAGGDGEEGEFIIFICFIKI